jgi:hypothetical protein
MGTLVNTCLCLLYLIVHVLHCPPPPPAHSFRIGPAVKNTHTVSPWVGSRSQLVWWLGLHQTPWSFGFNSQMRGTKENRDTPCVKVPGSSRAPVCDGQTSPHRPRIVVSRSTCPPLSPSPLANSFVIGTTVLNTHSISVLLLK